MKKSAPSSKKPPKQHMPAFRDEAVKLAEYIRIAAAAHELSLYESQPYSWRSNSRVRQCPLSTSKQLWYRLTPAEE